MNPQPPHLKKKLLIQAAILFFSPVILLVVSLLLYAVVNLMFANLGVADDGIAVRILNVTLFAVGAFASIMLIVGPILAILRLVRALKLP